jgi:hypothetical protein
MAGKGPDREPGGWLFADDARRAAPFAPPRSAPPVGRRANHWLNAAFVVVLLGLVLNATSQLWFFIVAIAWVGAGVAVTVKRRRQSPPQRLGYLFNDEEPDGG